MTDEKFPTRFLAEYDYVTPPNPAGHHIAAAGIPGPGITSTLALLPVTFDMLLKDLLSKIGLLIEKAENAGEVLLASAGTQIATAIEFAKISYFDSLQITIDKLTSIQQSIINDITSEIAYIEENVLNKIQEIIDQGSIILNQLPLSNHFPQVGFFSPSYIYTNDTNNDINITFKGNFFDCARKGYTPTLQYNSKTYTPSINTTLCLSFTIPYTEFQPFQKNNQLVYASMQLLVPYVYTKWLIIPTKQTATFSIVINILPPTIGIIKFHSEHWQTVTDTQSNRGISYNSISSDDDIPDPIGSGKEYISDVTPGWFIEPSKVIFIIEHQEGNWTNFGNRSKLTAAIWSIGTRHIRFGESGKVRFHLEWTEYRHRPIKIGKDQDITLNWRSSRAFTIEAGTEWSATFTDFQGNSDIITPASKNRFVSISTSGNQVIITTIP